MANIYISSTYSDLVEHREAVYRTLRRNGHNAIAMEDYVAIDKRPLDKCLEDVASCDIYVGIFAWRYGYIPKEDNPAQKSITELEFRHAVANGIDCLIFLMDEDHPWPPARMAKNEEERGQIEALRAEFSNDFTVSFFKRPENLANLVGTAVSTWEKEQQKEEQANSEQTSEASRRISQPEPQPREIIYHALLTYADTDLDFIKQLSEQLETRGRRLLLSPRALFAKDRRTFETLEQEVRQCHTAIIVLSDTLLSQIETQPKDIQRILDTLQTRTGHVILIAKSQETLKRTADMYFSAVIDASSWDPDSSSSKIELISNVDQAIAAGCPTIRGRNVGVPFIVIAMNNQEADELFHEDIIKQESGIKTADQFHALIKAVNIEPDTFIKRYQTIREEWCPFNQNKQEDHHTIREVIAAVVNFLNTAHTGQLLGRRIKIQHYPFNAILNREMEFSRIYQEIATTGCVVVVDEFSMFHPTIRKSFATSPLASSTQVAIATISPFDPFRASSQLVLGSELETHLAVAIDRYIYDFDPQCEFGVGNEHLLKRWLHNSLPRTLHSLREPQPNNSRLNQFKEQFGQKLEADYTDLLYSKGGTI